MGISLFYRSGCLNIVEELLRCVFFVYKITIIYYCSLSEFVQAWMPIMFIYLSLPWISSIDTLSCTPMGPFLRVIWYTQSIEMVCSFIIQKAV